MRRVIPRAQVTLVLAVAAVYAASLSAPFLFDDTAAVVTNATIRDLGSSDVLRPPADGSTTTGRPLVNLSLAIDYALGGGRPWIFRVTNVVLHALAALTLFGLLRRIAATARWAFAIALLWAVHPLQTETVAGIAQRTELLCGLLLLVTLYAFARGWRAVAVVACLAGMAAKEVMVVAPLLVLLYDRTFMAGSFAAAWRARRGTYAAFAATWLLLAVLVAQSGGARGNAAGFGLGITPWTYLLTQADALVLYLRLAVWPHPLVVDYGTAVIGSWREVAGQGVVVLALLGATVWALVRRPVLGFAGAWFFLILAPSSSFVPLITQTVAEHRMYLPLAAVLAVGVPLIAALVQGRAVLAACALALGGTAVVHLRVYRDAVTLWRDAVAKRPDNPRAHHNFALALHEAGHSAAAEPHFARAIALRPDYAAAHHSRGVALLAQRRAAEAVAPLTEAVRLVPEHADAHLNLGTALTQAGRPGDAVAHFEAALRLKPAADARYNVGIARAALGDDDRAAEDFAAALRLDSSLAEARIQLARSQARIGLQLARAGRLPEAAERLRAAIGHDQGNAEAHANLGNVLLLVGDARAALASFEAALRLRPDDARLRASADQARAALP